MALKAQIGHACFPEKHQTQTAGQTMARGRRNQGEDASDDTDQVDRDPAPAEPEYAESDRDADAEAVQIDPDPFNILQQAPTSTSRPRSIPIQENDISSSDDDDDDDELEPQPTALSGPSGKASTTALPGPGGRTSTTASRSRSRPIHGNDISSSSDEEEVEALPGSSARTSTTAPASANTVRNRGKKQTKKFSHQWLGDFAWLEYDRQLNLMKCSLCRRRNPTANDAFIRGTNNFRIKTIRDHISSKGHRIAEAGEANNQPRLNAAAAAMEERRNASFTCALECAYFCASEEISNSKYGSLVTFLRHRGDTDARYLRRGDNATYTSPTIFNQLLESISGVVIDDLKGELRGAGTPRGSPAPFVAVGVDESTDRSQEKHVVVVVRYVSSTGKLTTMYLGMEAIPDGRSGTVMAALETVLGEFGVPWSRVVGLGSDGAAVMTGELTGLTARVHLKNPFCIAVHCVCHRLNLAVSQACTRVPDMQAIERIVSAIYNFVQINPNRLTRLKELASVLELDVVKFKRHYDIRWLSLQESVSAIITNYRSLMTLLDQENAQEEPVAVGLYKQLKSYNFVALLHLAADVLGETNNLSKQFQFRDISFECIGEKIANCKANLRLMLANPGTHLTLMMNQFETTDGRYCGVKLEVAHRRRGRQEAQDMDQSDQRATFRKNREDIISNLLQNLDARFPQVELLSAMQIFDPASYLFDREDQLSFWGPTTSPHC
ncbi:zinc finger protein 862-like [Amphiura filiformis]|uniref:zinc finger protein 862-like n=1 Tax=Amphiura filiformis TaxID=82378 RepID=UPI003B216CF2